MLEKLNTKRTLLILALAVIGFNMLFFLMGLEMKRHHGSSEVLDIQFGYTPETAMRILSNMGEYGRSLARYTILADMVYPLVYGLLFLILLYRFMPRLPVAFLEYVIYALPVMAVICDWLENIWEWRMMTHFPDNVMTLAPMGSVFTTIKWYAVLASLVVLGIEVLIALYYPTLRKHGTNPYYN